MKTYQINPLEGVCEAYFVVNPGAEMKDLVEWLTNQECSDSDPRISLYSLANLCDQALDELMTEQDCWVDPRLVALVSGALAHFETSVRAFSAIIGHRSFQKLARMTPVEALKKCLPNNIKSKDLS